MIGDDTGFDNFISSLLDYTSNGGFFVPACSEEDCSMILVVRGGRRGGGEKEDGTARRGGSRGWKYGERLSEKDRAKGIILIAPDFLSSPLCDPRVRFLIHPLSLGLPPPTSLLAAHHPAPTALSHFCD